MTDVMLSNTLMPSLGASSRRSIKNYSRVTAHYPVDNGNAGIGLSTIKRGESYKFRSERHKLAT